MDRKRVFIHSEDAELAVQLVKLLDRHGVTAFWLTQEQAEKLEQLGQWDACIRQVQGMARWWTERPADRSLLSEAYG